MRPIKQNKTCLIPAMKKMFWLVSRNRIHHPTIPNHLPGPTRTYQDHGPSHISRLDLSQQLDILAYGWPWDGLIGDTHRIDEVNSRLSRHKNHHHRHRHHHHHHHHHHSQSLIVHKKIPNLVMTNSSPWKDPPCY